MLTPIADHIQKQIQKPKAVVSSPFTSIRHGEEVAAQTNFLSLLQMLTASTAVVVFVLVVIVFVFAGMTTTMTTTTTTTAVFQRRGEEWEEIMFCL